MKKKTIKNVSKTFFAAFVIFHISIVSAAFPVVSYAFENAEENTNQAVEESSKEESSAVVNDESKEDVVIALEDESIKEDSTIVSGQPESEKPSDEKPSKDEDKGDPTKPECKDEDKDGKCDDKCVDENKNGICDDKEKPEECKENCDKPEEDKCPVEGLYARFILTNTSKGISLKQGWRNWGNGNNEGKIFVGTNQDVLPEMLNDEGRGVYGDREWIPLVDENGQFINDADISGYRDVPGVAVQRMNGKLRVVLFGGHNDSTSKELAAGSIELSTDMSTRLTNAWTKGNGFYDPLQINTDSHTGSREHDPFVNDAQNPMDARGNFNGYIHQYNPRFDNVRIIADLFQFHLVATTDSDGFYAGYDFGGLDPEKPCDDGEDKKTGTLVVYKFVIGVTDQNFSETFSFMGPEAEFDIMTEYGPGNHGDVSFDASGTAIIENIPTGVYDIDELGGESEISWDVENTCKKVDVTEDRIAYCHIVNTLDDGGGNDGPEVIVNENCVLVAEDFPTDELVRVEGLNAPFYVKVVGLEAFVPNEPQTITVTISVIDYFNPETIYIAPQDYTFQFVNSLTDCDDDNTGGGDDDNPVLTVPSDACFVVGTTINLLEGVSAVDFAGDAIDLSGNLTMESNPMGVIDPVTETLPSTTEVGTYTIIYTVSDPFGSDTEDRVITIATDCNNGGGGGGGGGGSSGGGGHSHHQNGEVLGATSCVQFTKYYDTGDAGGEIKALQIFLNEYMDAGLTVNGVYDVATTQAVHNLQALYWDEIIDPWTPPLNPNTTGRFYKTTRATVNALMGCPESQVFLEDPQTFFEISEVLDAKDFSKDAVVEALLVAQLTEQVNDLTIQLNNLSGTDTSAYSGASMVYEK
ncbi:MAG: hypothetical protein IT284_01425 [Bacteroidetes bacterium]|nr:hypothetical protein [Bacteroidota bacterium]